MEKNMNKKKLTTITTDSNYIRGQINAGKYARVSSRCISEWQARRIIPFIKVGRKCVLFRKSDIDAALSRYEAKAV